VGVLGRVAPYSSQLTLVSGPPGVVRIPADPGPVDAAKPEVGVGNACAMKVTCRSALSNVFIYWGASD
jgi:hypothetical protein